MYTSQSINKDEQCGTRCVRHPSSVSAVHITNPLCNHKMGKNDQTVPIAYVDDIANIKKPHTFFLAPIS